MIRNGYGKIVAGKIAAREPAPGSLKRFTRTLKSVAAIETAAPVFPLPAYAIPESCALFTARQGLPDTAADIDRGSFAALPGVP